MLLRLLAMGLLLSLPGPGSAASAAHPAPESQSVLGRPLLQRFGPEDYKAAPLQMAVASDSHGRMLFGNIEGLLRFDGASWKLIETPGHGPVNSVARGRDGHVYVGSYDSFGWLVTDAEGRTRYRSLLAKAHLSGTQRDIGTTWSVLPTPEGVYFRSERSLHYLDYAHQHAENWPLPDKARGFYTDGDSLYARYQGQGFGRIEDGVFHLAPGGAIFADMPLADMIPMDGWRLLVGSDGLYRADAHGIRPLPGGAGRALLGHQPYTAARLPDGGLAIGCRDGTVFQYSADFHLRQSVNLGHFAINALGTDNENGLWAATGGGLVRMAMPSPWSFLGGQQGVNGTILDFAWYDHALWLAGSNGLSRVSSGARGTTVEHMPWTRYEAFSLLSTDQGLLIGHRDGLLLLEPGMKKPRELVGKGMGSIFIVQHAAHDPNLVYALGDQHLFLLRLDQGHWQRFASLPTGNLRASDLIETAPGVLWMDNARGGPQRWRIDPSTGHLLNKSVFGADQGIVIDPHQGSVIYRLDGVLHAVSGHRGYRFDGSRFVPDTGAPFTLVERPDELTITPTRLGTYAYTSRQLWFRAPDSQHWSKLNLDPNLAAGYNALRFNRDGVLRISTWTGLLQFDPQQHVPAPARPDLFLDSIAIRSTQGDRKARELPLPVGNAPVMLPPGHSMTLHYSMVSMAGALFRYRIPGVMPDWSDWRDGEIFIRALRPGVHVLVVQARPRGSHDIEEKRLRFEAMPHWYQQWWAWLAALAGLAVASTWGTGITVQHKTRRYQRANQRLEIRIAERTRELQEANHRLAELATEDALTGVANRRALEQGMRREWARCQDQRRPLSALMIDIDHFKQFNDKYGHMEGDKRLKAFARHLRDQHDPRRELLARYGGEEFALLLPDVSLESAYRRAEALRQGIADSDLGLTVSMGVAGFVPNTELDPDSLLRRADSALYQAKHSGRNRVVVDAD